MNPRKTSGPEFNSPHDMAVRGVFVAAVSCGLLALAVIITGSVTHNLHTLAAGGIAVMITVVLVHWLREPTRLQALHFHLDSSDDGPVGEDVTSEPTYERFAQLLEDWDRMEHKRGSREFDPWESQSLRHTIESAVEENPSLSRLFRNFTDGRK